MYYNFHKDLAASRESEHQAVVLCYMLFDVVDHEFQQTSSYDALLTMADGSSLYVEVKEDFMAKKTGNVAIEYESRGKPSGISVTKSDWFIYKIHNKLGWVFLFFHPDDIRHLIEEGKYSRIVSGGDPGSNTKMYLFKADKLEPIAVHRVSYEA